MTDQVGNGLAEQKLPGSGCEEVRTEKDDGPSLGVLFVHGIGEQKRGDTLPWAGDALFKWYRLWSCHGNIEVSSRAAPCEPYLTDTRLMRPVPSEMDAPPFSHMKFQTTNQEVAQREQEWILAESWWASEFTPPTYAEMVVLGLSIAPWLIEQTGLRIIGDILRVVRDNNVLTTLTNQPRRGAPAGKPVDFLSRAFGWISDRLLDIAAVITWVMVGFLLLTVGVLAQTLILALWVLALIPPLRDPVVKLQLGLTGWLGDAYLMATSPIRFSAMVSQVRRDVQWLASKQAGKGCCKTVAVIAHSGGAVVAHEALTGPGAPQIGQDILLITYGSGQSKVDTIAKLRNDRTPFFRFSPVFRAAGVLFALAALYLGVQ
ncbi:MAG TPA: hypothetical protein VFH60_11535, partial [Chloroflexia bacterium]|nr:hypothetical protein [Chloroflexia bacterium]